MEIKEVKTVLIGALEKPENDSMKVKYADSMAEYLKNHKSSDELISIVVNGVDIDRAANYFDYLEGVSKNDLQSVWKQVRENKEILLNKNNNGLKFVAGLLGLSFMNVGNMEIQRGNILSKLVSMVDDDKKPISSRIYEPIILDYFVNDIAEIKNYPRWETFRQTGEIQKRFAEILLQSTLYEQEEKYKGIRQWATSGVRLAENQIKTEKIEAKIPKSKIEDMMVIVEHYKSVEKQVRDDEYKIARLEDTIDGLQNDISNLNSEKKILQSNIRSLKDNIEIQKKDLEKAAEEIDERKSINDAFTALKKNDEEGILKDIAEDLKLTYGQMKRSENMEMNAELGEIYREMLKRVFKSLEKKGIRMD